MEFLITLITFIFIGMLIAATLTLGFTLILIVAGAFAIFYAYMLVRSSWRRWRFLHHARPSYTPPPPKTKTIETEYENITDIDYE